MSENPEITVSKNLDQSRYELRNGEKVISYATFNQTGTTVSIPLVFTPPEFRGNGYAAQLMAGIVTLTEEANEKIKPICSYASAYLERTRRTES